MNARLLLCLAGAGLRPARRCCSYRPLWLAFLFGRPPSMGGPEQSTPQASSRAARGCRSAWRRRAVFAPGRVRRPRESRRRGSVSLTAADGPRAGVCARHRAARTAGRKRAIPTRSVRNPGSDEEQRRQRQDGALRQRPAGGLPGGELGLDLGEGGETLPTQQHDAGDHAEHDERRASRARRSPRRPG